MLPIASIPLVTTRPVAVRKGVMRTSAVQKGTLAKEQRARPRATKSGPHTLEGELFYDIKAVAGYLSAAGELREVQPGQLVSVYA